MTPQLSLVGEPPRTRLLAQALTRADLGSRQFTQRQAQRSPGSLDDSPLVVFCWPPGHDLVLESEAFTIGSPALHAWWSAETSSVGPLVIPLVSPCPRCLSTRALRPAQGPSPMMASWACSTVALEAALLLRARGARLLDTTITMSMLHPALAIEPYEAVTGCRTPGCVGQP